MKQGQEPGKNVAGSLSLFMVERGSVWGGIKVYSQV